MKRSKILAAIFSITLLLSGACLYGCGSAPWNSQGATEQNSKWTEWTEGENKLGNVTIDLSGLVNSDSDEAKEFDGGYVTSGTCTPSKMADKLLDRANYIKDDEVYNQVKTIENQKKNMGSYTEQSFYSWFNRNHFAVFYDKDTFTKNKHVNPPLNLCADGIALFQVSLDSYDSFREAFAKGYYQVADNAYSSHEPDADAGDNKPTYWIWNDGVLTVASPIQDFTTPVSVHSYDQGKPWVYSYDQEKFSEYFIPVDKWREIVRY